LQTGSLLSAYTDFMVNKAEIRRTVFLLASLFFIASTASAQNLGDDDFMKYWEPVSAGALPTIVPEGKLDDFKLALERQIENCREYREGRFTKCTAESGLVKLVCHEPTLHKMLELVRESASWKSLYAKSKTAFNWFRYKANDGKVLFTAYNAPGYDASLKPTAKYRHPLYTRPEDLVDLKGPDGKPLWRKRLPDGTYDYYDDRKTIDVDHSLAGKGLEVAYLENPLDIMRLQLEGSGLLRLKSADGRTKEVGANYAGQNGRKMVSITKYLREKGVDPKYYTFKGQKLYFEEHPEELWPALITNPSYVFFSVTGEPPCGTARVYLTPRHSLAVDPNHVPFGSMVLIDTYRPVPAKSGEQKDRATVRFTRFAMAQDAGGAIVGAHVDTYWGSDDYAQYLSDTMSERGAMFYPRLK